MKLTCDKYHVFQKLFKILYSNGMFFNVTLYQRSPSVQFLFKFRYNLEIKYSLVHFLIEAVNLQK